MAWPAGEALAGGDCCRRGCLREGACGLAADGKQRVRCGRHRC
ncbi:hypothetical protein BIFGAL_03992 [Bifidobacterium gallicum DSM 20093 = LMG 11596]|uniref:Uncharacterized protein n=1 Tax=Bifidobacterium gallicum DSM 20093 = LMG 11596 TaxID=561180 RepID=D1NVU8_9BIFI|nr:hypothetical protein BIFGAL_03992 [Bifidobacterium gallicum DSM 20093 = LMG 11596]